MKKTIVIIVLAVILLGGMFVLAWYVEATKGERKPTDHVGTNQGAPSGELNADDEYDPVLDYIERNPGMTDPPSPSPAVLQPLRTFDDVFDYNGLVDITELSHDFVLDIRFATTKNNTRTPQYPFQMALMQKGALKQLLKANEQAMKDGFRIRIYDTYRPFSVQVAIYEANPPELSAFVAKPSKNEKHSIGVAIDCGLSYMDGTEVEMTSDWDEFNEKAYATYKGGTDEQRANRDYLISLMSKFGFSVYSKEWWHFNFPTPAGMVAMDIPFDEFTRLREAAYASGWPDNKPQTTAPRQTAQDPTTPPTTEPAAAVTVTDEPPRDPIVILPDENNLPKPDADRDVLP